MNISETVNVFIIVSSIVAVLAILYVLVDWLLERRGDVPSTPRPRKKSDRRAATGKGGPLFAAVACVSAAIGAAATAMALKGRGKKTEDSSKSSLRLTRSRPIKSRSHQKTGRHDRSY